MTYIIPVARFGDEADAANGYSCQAAGRRDLPLSLAVLTCATLALTALGPGLAASLAIFSLPAASGLPDSRQPAFVVRVPNERRVQAFGTASMGVLVGRGAGFLAGA